MRRQAHTVLRLAGGGLNRTARRLYTPPLSVQAQRVVPWTAADGDNTLRVDYDLTPDSTVLDLGGYEGGWASDIYSRYRCTIHVFEPVPDYHDRIQHRFARNPDITVHPVGLAGADGETCIGVLGVSSSAFLEAERSVTVRLRRAASFFEEAGIAGVELMKINIEGGEYDLLEHLLDEGLAQRIRDLQVQFHDFVPQAERRMRAIQERLSSTHALTYQYPFVWENWRRRALRQR